MAAVVWTVMLSTGMLISMLETRKEGLWVSIPPFLLLEQSQQVFIESCSLVTWSWLDQPASVYTVIFSCYINPRTSSSIQTPNCPDISPPCEELLTAWTVILVLMTAESLHFPEGEGWGHQHCWLQAALSSDGMFLERNLCKKRSPTLFLSEEGC